MWSDEEDEQMDRKALSASALVLGFRPLSVPSTSRDPREDDAPMMASDSWIRI